MEFYPELLILLVVGAVAGTLAGLFGVGGGIIIVPVLVWLLGGHPAISNAYLMHIAIATSLATIVLTAISSIYAHHRRGAVRWDIVQQFLLGTIIGGIFGAFVADALSSATLKIVFAVFIFFVGLHIVSGKQPSPHRQLPNLLSMNVVSFLIATASALVGIGGGSLTVPFLTWCNISIRQAVATSAACGLPIAVFGALGFIVMGWGTPDLPAWSLGYVYLPALLAIVVTSLLFAPLGAKLAHSLPVKTLKRFFAVLLLVVSVKMLLS